MDAAEAEAKAATEALDATETEALKLALGFGQGKGAGSARGVAGSAGLLKELEGRQKRRLTRMQRDCLDRALTDLLAFYRDVLAVQLTGGARPAARAPSRCTRTSGRRPRSWRPGRGRRTRCAASTRSWAPAGPSRRTSHRCSRWRRWRSRWAEPDFRRRASGPLGVRAGSAARRPRSAPSGAVGSPTRSNVAAHCGVTAEHRGKIGPTSRQLSEGTADDASCRLCATCPEHGRGRAAAGRAAPPPRRSARPASPSANPD